MPGISCQKIIIQEKAIQLLTKSGIMIEIGNISKIKDKFTSLKYFLGYYRKKISKTDFIDIRFPNRVIIKPIGNEF